MKNILFTIWDTRLIGLDNQVWEKLCESKKAITYLIFQHEIAPSTGKEHLQGYCELSYSMVKEKFQKMMSQGELVEFTVKGASGSAASNLAYTTKTETAIPDSKFVYGEPKKRNQGERNDVKRLYALAKNLEISEREAADEEPAAYMRMHQAFDRVRTLETQHFAREKMYTKFRGKELRPWQAQLVEEFTVEPDDRTIKWIVDLEGNQGKTWFAKWCCINLDAERFKNGSTRDISYAFKGKRICFINLTRTAEEKYINYSLMEDIKDEGIWCPKWHSHMKEFVAPHLVILSNQYPDTDRCSKDRWEISKLNNGILTRVDRPDWPIFVESEWKGKIAFN